MSALSPEQLNQMQLAAIEACHAIAKRAINGVEQLSQINAQAMRASWFEIAQTFKTGLGLKDAKQLSEFVSSSSQPTLDKSATYVRNAMEILNETTSEIVRIVERQAAENNRHLYASIDSLAKNAPAGSEGMVTLVKQAVSAANTAYDQVSKATKQVAEMTEVNMAAAAKAPPPPNGRARKAV